MGRDPYLQKSDRAYVAHRLRHRPFPVRDIGWGSYFRQEGLPALTSICAYLTEFAERCRKGQLPPLKEWEALASTLLTGCGSELTPEAALALYYYHTHRQDIERAGYEWGMTGYTGVMQELIDEISIRGLDRLLRKLSVDMCVLIPQCSSLCSELTAAAEALAAKYGLLIHAPKIKDVEIPAFDRTHRDGYTKQEKGFKVGHLETSRVFRFL